jgi:hypothetical protein
MTQIELIHQVPPGIDARLYRAPFGLYVAVVRAADEEFTAGGDTDHLALRRALRKAERRSA